MASQAAHGTVDLASPLEIVLRDGAADSARIETRSTDGLAPRHALPYWRDGVLRRMELLDAPAHANASGPQRFHARLIHVAGPGADLVQHISDAVSARRDRQRIRRDGCDDVSISLLASARPTRLVHRGDHVLRGGDVFVTDYAQPMEILRPRHHDISLICSRQRLEQALGGDVSLLAGRRLPRRGLAMLLGSHLRLLSAQMQWLTPPQRAAAVRAAVDMALAGLQTEMGLHPHDERMATGGLHHAALLAIHRECHDPQLAPERVAALVGCSRATLYRVFATQGGSVAAAIWSTRIERAHALLTGGQMLHLQIAEIAHRCGFADPPTFNRMFKRRYGMTPLEARDYIKQSSSAYPPSADSYQ